MTQQEINASFTKESNDSAFETLYPLFIFSYVSPSITPSSQAEPSVFVETSNICNNENMILLYNILQKKLYLTSDEVKSILSLQLKSFIYCSGLLQQSSLDESDVQCAIDEDPRATVLIDVLEELEKGHDETLEETPLTISSASNDQSGLIIPLIQSAIAVLLKNVHHWRLSWNSFVPFSTKVKC
ncbi:hypothetical protein FDP41_007464 [Naegleria fowleri]|uniref:Uncharacterized protein n=1 Tax=Naegleria fowleri TaxID=5763 RepID=A0A6A5C4R2_NAEFO|nr:uncharacterized protein FDP41_007464 [Naegleria fowleri]KAF0984287.1 hypothetical protein FDP41_007464 [Naegleria fowleri]